MTFCQGEPGRPRLSATSETPLIERKRLIIPGLLLRRHGTGGQLADNDQRKHKS